MCGEDRGPIVPAYSSRRRPKINICSKEFQHIFPFGTDQRKATGNLLFVLKSSEAIIETFPNTMSSWEIPFPLMIIWGIKPRLCWEDVWGILLKVCLPSSRLTCQPDRVVCWPEESWPEVAHDGAGWHISPICRHPTSCTPQLQTQFVQHTFLNLSKVDF